MAEYAGLFEQSFGTPEPVEFKTLFPPTESAPPPTGKSTATATSDLEARIARLEARFEYLTRLQEERVVALPEPFPEMRNINPDALCHSCSQNMEQIAGRLISVEWQLGGISQAWTKEEREKVRLGEWGKSVDKTLKTLSDRARVADGVRDGDVMLSDEYHPSTATPSDFGFNIPSV